MKEGGFEIQPDYNYRNWCSNIAHFIKEDGFVARYKTQRNVWKGLISDEYLISIRLLIIIMKFLNLIKLHLNLMKNTQISLIQNFQIFDLMKF